MSTPAPGTPRRRRIAGERRDRVAGADQAPAPVTLTKAPTGTPAEPRTPPTGWWGSVTSLVVLGVLLAVLLSLTGLVAFTNASDKIGVDNLADRATAQATERAMRTAPSAAEAAAAAILAYDFKTLEADQDAATRFMTEEFGAKYTDTFEKVVLPAAKENRAKVTATVLASSVLRATEDTARVLLFVDQSTVSRANERPQIALNRVEMSMVLDGDTWLVDDISSY